MENQLYLLVRVKMVVVICALTMAMAMNRPMLAQVEWVADTSEPIIILERKHHILVQDLIMPGNSVFIIMKVKHHHILGKGTIRLITNLVKELCFWGLDPVVADIYGLIILMARKRFTSGQEQIVPVNCVCMMLSEKLEVFLEAGISVRITNLGK